MDKPEVKLTEDCCHCGGTGKDGDDFCPVCEGIGIAATDYGSLFFKLLQSDEDPSRVQQAGCSEACRAAIWPNRR